VIAELQVPPEPHAKRGGVSGKKLGGVRELTPRLLSFRRLVSTGESESELRSFLLFQRRVERVTTRHRTRGVLTVTLNLHLLCIIGIGTVVTAVGLQSRDLALALLMRTFVSATHIDNFCHNPPRVSEFVLSQFLSTLRPVWFARWTLG